MPKARFETLEESKRDRLFQAASQEFADRGFNGSSIHTILAEAGMSKSTFYYYFEDKADLFVATLLHVFGHDWRFLPGQILDFSKPVWPQLEQQTIEIFELMERNPQVPRLFQVSIEAVSDLPDRPELQNLRKHMRQGMKDFVDAMIDAGYVPRWLPQDMLIEVLISIRVEFARKLVESWDRVSPDKILRMARTLIDVMKALFPSQAGKPKPELTTEEARDHGADTNRDS